MGTTEQTFAYDPFSPEVLHDPGTHHSRLVQECPVHRYQGNGFDFYSLARYDDVLDGLRDIQTWSSHWGQGPHRTPPHGMLADPPQHTMFRRMVLQAFTSRVVERMEPWVAQLTEELIDAIEATGTRQAELHDDVASPLPVITIARILGVPEDMKDQFKFWSDVQVAGMGQIDRTFYEKNRKELEDFFLEQVNDRRALRAADKEMPDDLTSDLVVAAEEAPKPVEDVDMLSVLLQLLVGGNETTTSLITNCVWRLLERRELWEQVCADPRLVEVAMEESLRFDAPVLGLFRTNTCPVTRHGVEIPEDSKVMMLYSAADRDPSVFEDPDTFRLDRDVEHLRRRHLAFGSGIHHCLGAPLARLETRIAVGALTRRLPTMELAGPTERIEPFLLYGQHRLPVRW
jgi:cytochrome P450